MQCKHCGNGPLEQAFEEDHQQEMKMIFIESQFRCNLCGAVHSLKFNWADFDLTTLPISEVVLP